ncbi:thioredoxin [Alicyclobacillus tolerans]|uniref:Thioredoxin n=2 Tax=Alicyclobacillus tolerans TaxID=90970 RepID=A0ABT9LSB2_9BACL|nr:MULTISPECIES: thioredoxin [Alicyclobacillus]MDP9727138.1 thioredoxin 1 [Alicyclobacillus tengchongensis]QRF22907.1 thioredoxin [Alicyclobacillus sp. TC]SHK47288.1 thioredoxin [Alicyclobacillus montanus]
MATQKVTDQTFASLLQQGKPVLVDFWAAWCGPCRMMAPVLEELSNEYADKLIVAKLDVDENPQTASQFGIMSIPTLLLFENGQVSKSVVGFRPKEHLVAELSSVLT